MLFRIFLLTVVLPLFPANLWAQCLPGSESPIELSDQAVISMITVYPGDQIHAFWGHSAVRVRDPYHGFDIMYNYGAFQFDEAFLAKFIYGQLDYVLCVSHMRGELRKYQEVEKRSVVEQVLALEQDQRQAIFNFLENNALPENRTYRYNFLFDNCTTRIRDLFEHILGESLLYDSRLAPDRSFRQILQSYVDEKPFLSLGIDLGLGMPVDREPTAREIMGLPLYFMEAYDYAVIDSAGVTRPFVINKDTLLWIESETNDAGGGSQVFLYAFVWLLFAVSLWVSNSRASFIDGVRIWFDRLLFAFMGLTGLLALFLWFISLHDVANYNWNLLWAWPTHAFIVFLLSRKKNRVRYYMRLFTIVLLITLLGWYYWPQELNIALAPVLLAALVRSFWWGWRFAAERRERLVLY